jgi:hypothetical protein
MPEGKLREKGKKESQVFASMADNPRHVFSASSSSRLRDKNPTNTTGRLSCPKLSKSYACSQHVSRRLAQNSQTFVRGGPG